MKRTLIATIFIVGLFGLVACSSDDDSEIVVRTEVGNITKEQFYEELKDQYGEEILWNLVMVEVLNDEYDVGEDDIDSEVTRLKDQLGEQFDMWMMQEGISDEEALRDLILLSLLREYAATEDIEVTEDEVEDEYDRIKTEVELKHILVDEEEVADEVRNKLAEGEAFDDLVKEYTLDEGSIDNGGDLGYIAINEMPPEFVDIVFDLEEGDIGGPIGTQSGFHIVQLTDKREIEDIQSFDELKEEIRRDLLNEKIDPMEAEAKINSMLEDANVDVKIKEFEDLFDTNPFEE